MSPTRHRPESSGSYGDSSGALFLGGLLGALLIFVHHIAAGIPGLAAYYLRKDGHLKPAIGVIAWTLVLAGVRLYLQLNGYLPV